MIDVASPTATGVGGRTRKAALPLILIGGAVTTAAATIVGNGSVVLAVAPVVLVAILLLVVVTPIRYTLFALVFLALAIDVSSQGPWDSPLAPLGRLLYDNLDKTIHVPLPMPGEMFVLIGLLLVYFQRAFSGSSIDAAGREATPGPLQGALLVSFLTVLLLSFLGYLRGGDLRMARLQTQNFVLILLVAYLSGFAFRGLRDYRILGKIIVAAACIKALLAIYVMQVIQPMSEMATTHGDSLLFAGATMLLVARYFEKPTPRHLFWCGLFLPVLVFAMIENNRRLVWVEIAAAFALLWVISRRTHAKRFFAHALIAMVPIFAAYVAIGWESNAKIFAPIQTYKSVNGTEENSSTLYRDTENYNLMQSMQLSPLIGSGFGLPFTEFVKLPDISFFKEYQFLPHNSILGVWVFSGAFGFSGLVTAFVVAAFFARRGYLFARTPDERVAAFMCLAMLVIHIVQCWGDIGFNERRSIFLVGPALALAGQLAVSTGAWRFRSGAGPVVHGVLKAA